MIHNIPTFQACKSSLYRNRAKTKQELPTLQEETLMVHRPAHQLEKCSSSVTTLMPRDIESRYSQRIQTFNTCVQRRQCLLMEPFIRVPNSIHPACQCQWNHVSPRLWAFTEQEGDDIHPFLCVIEGCST